METTQQEKLEKSIYEGQNAYSTLGSRRASEIEL